MSVSQLSCTTRDGLPIIKGAVRVSHQWWMRTRSLTALLSLGGQDLAQPEAADKSRTASDPRLGRHLPRQRHCREHRLHRDSWKSVLQYQIRKCLKERLERTVTVLVEFCVVERRPPE